METESEAPPLWTNELGFSDWLHANIDELGTVINVGLISRQREARVGRLSADIRAEVRDSGEAVIIENQIDPSDHDHFGRLLTYAAGFDALIIVWIARSFRNEHRNTIAWLNSLSYKRFYAVQLNGFGTPTFEVVARPNSTVRAGGRSATLPLIVVPPSRHAYVGHEQGGAFVQAPFSVPASHSTRSPGQMMLDAIFEAIRRNLVGATVFGSLRNPTHDRNYFVVAKGPVPGSEWSIVFEDTRARIELVLNDESTAIRDLGRVAEHADSLSRMTGEIVHAVPDPARKKQKATIYHPFSSSEKSLDAEGVAAWCSQAVVGFAEAVRDAGIF